MKIQKIILSFIAFMLLGMSTAQAKTNLGDQNTMAVVWYQTSAEVKALYV
ncbi:hypothetical protein [Ligilactobacillus murinus]|nr:hypothetical protein [Ligilactobacillus murinus]